MEFSVLMSIYYKENPDYLRQCLDSLVSQTVMPTEIVIVKDGPLTDGLESVFSEYVAKNEGLYKFVPLETNHGLGFALAEGVKNCSYELIARMDTDDISRIDRFEIQLKEFESDPDLDICGSHIEEFEDDVTNIVAKRTVPLEDAAIKKYQKKRDGFNHMTVMFKKSAVLKAGNYQSYLCRSAIDKSQIVLHSDGKTTKSYCYIMDCISAMIYILVKGESTAYNVSNPDAVASVCDLAKFVSNKYIGLPVVLENKALDMYPISSCLILDSKKLSKLGWAPKVGIEEAFNRLINLMKE